MRWNMKWKFIGITPQMCTWPGCDGSKIGCVFVVVSAYVRHDARIRPVVETTCSNCTNTKGWRCRVTFISQSNSPSGTNRNLWLLGWLTERCHFCCCVLFSRLCPCLKVKWFWCMVCVGRLGLSSKELEFNCDVLYSKKNF